jgi:hypothetical protein
MERSILPLTWQVPQIFRDRLGNKVGYQRAMEADQHLLLVLHRPPKPDEVEREGRFFWRQPDASWNSSHHGGGPNALVRHLDEYEQQVRHFDEMEERATSAPEYFSVLDGLAPLLRAARHLHQVLQEARKLLPNERELINFRDRAYDIERTAELLYSDARNSLEFLVARKTEENAVSSRRMEVAAHRLNKLAAFFLPLATISALVEVDPDKLSRHAQQPLTLIVLTAAGLTAGWLLTQMIGARRDEKKPA